MNALVHIHISFLRGVYAQSLVIKTLSPTDGDMASIYLVFEQKYIYMLYLKCLKKSYLRVHRTWVECKLSASRIYSPDIIFM